VWHVSKGDVQGLSLDMARKRMTVEVSDAASNLPVTVAL
jgi:hypothetical protein